MRPRAAIVSIIALLLLVTTSGCSGIWSDKGPVQPYRSFYHTVKPGETLSQIGDEYGVPFPAIAELNKIEDTRNLRIGSRLLIRKPLASRTAQRGAPQHDVLTVKASSTNRPRLNSTKKGKLLWPVTDGEVVSLFGPRSGSFHDGLDIAAEKGTPVYAAHSGVVVYSGDDLSGYGNLLIVKNRSGVITIYAHNSKLYFDIGDKVKRGEKIALVGASGKASGPHLHFEVRIKDKRDRYVAIDPLPLLDGDVENGSRYRVNESLTPIIAKWISW